MSQQAYRANLSAAVFPLTLAKAGRSVIIPGPDQNFDRRVDPEGAQKDAGIPQAIYMENVLPTSEGYQSVGYITCPAITTAKFTRAIAEIPVGDGTSRRIIRHYTDGTVDHLWVGASNIFSADYFVSSAVCQAKSYVLIPNADLYEATAAAQVTLTNLNGVVTPANFFSANSIQCIVSSFNYLIAINNTTVYWSSTTTPTDFNASLVSGAGFENINNAGQLLFALPTPFGFYLFTTRNVIRAEYTGNRLYPFKFSPVSNSGSVVDINQAYSSADSNYAVALENERTLKLYQGGEATNILDDISLLLGRTTRYDQFDYATNVLSEVNNSLATSVDDFLRRKIQLINNRYLVISFQATGVLNRTIFSKAIVVDLYLRRYGMLKIQHTNVFTTEYGTSTQNLFVFYDTSTNTVKRVHLDVNQRDTLLGGHSYDTQQGVLILGRFQYARSRFLCLDELDIESAHQVGAANFSTFILPSVDGKTFGTPQTPTLRLSSGVLRSYYSHAEGKNFAVGIKGAFEVCSVELKFHLGGKW